MLAALDARDGADAHGPATSKLVCPRAAASLAFNASRFFSKLGGTDEVKVKEAFGWRPIVFFVAFVMGSPPATHCPLLVRDNEVPLGIRGEVT